MKCWTGWSTSWNQIASRNINNLRNTDDTTLMAESKEELKSLLMKVKEESEKAGLKLNSQKTKIVASSPITPGQIDGETMETVTDFIFLGSKITADGDCSHEMKWHLLLGRKTMTNLDSILKSRHYFANKCPSSQSYGFFSSSHVWMWELDHKEGWMPKNWCFQTVVLEKTLENPLDCKEIQPVHPEETPSWIIIGRTDTEDERPILWLPGVKNWKRPWCWERLKAGGEGGDRGWDGWMASPTRWTWVWASSGSWWWTGRPGVLQSTGSQRLGHDWATELNCWGCFRPETLSSNFWVFTHQFPLLFSFTSCSLASARWPQRQIRHMPRSTGTHTHTVQVQRTDQKFAVRKPNQKSF